MSPDAGEGKRMGIEFLTEKPPYVEKERPRKALRSESIRTVTLAPPLPVFRSETETETQKQALPQTAESFSVFDRELKYEVLEDAGVVQIQVIDTSNGEIVRKIPADEVIKFIKVMKAMKEKEAKIDDRVDVLA
jgi:uncharacterized FlaG/YvyC family protein